MGIIKKEEINEAWSIYYRNQKKINVPPEDCFKLIKKFFIDNSTPHGIDKLNEILHFKAGGAKAIFNKNKTAVLMFEMMNPPIWGIFSFISIAIWGTTRPLAVVDLEKNITYELYKGRGHKEVVKLVDLLLNR